MSYISRSDKLNSPRVKSARAHRKMRYLIFTAVLLSAVSIVLTAIVFSEFVGGRTHTYTSGEVVSSKLSSTNKQSSSVKKVVKGDGSTPQTEDNAAKDNADPTTAEPKIEETQVQQEQSSANKPIHNTVEESKKAPVKSTQIPVVAPKQPKKAQGQKIVYLTFDDGPGKHTEQILGILNRYQVHATFFMVGRQLSGYEQAVKDSHEAGNYVGLHSMSHSKKKLYDSDGSGAFIKEFTQEQKLMKQILGYSPTLIRAPYGSKPEIGYNFRGDIAKAGFKMWDWTVDSKDWKYPHSPDRIVKEVKRQTHRDVEVILMHEKTQTVKVLPQIIEYLQKKGYTFAVYKPDQHFSVNFGKDPRL